MNWKHRGVYETLRDRFGGSNESNKNKYAYLYNHNVIDNSAIIYHPDSPGTLSQRSVHLNKSKIDPELYNSILPYLKLVQTDNKIETSRFSHYDVVDWDGLAAALNLK